MFRTKHIPASNLVEMFTNRAARSANSVAYRYPLNNGWGIKTWRDAEVQTRSIASMLIAHGVQPRDRVAIMAVTSVDWIMAAFGIMRAGAVVVAIYPETGTSLEYILADSGAEIVFVDTEDRLRRVNLATDGVAIPIYLKNSSSSRTIDRFMELRTEASDRAVDERAQAITSDSLATLIYTSGSTGMPKGAMLSHSNWLAIARAMRESKILSEDDVEYAWLPLAHSFGMAMVVGHMAIGYVKYVDGDPTRIVTNLPIVQPTFMAGPPRIFEKIAAGVEAKVASSSWFKRKLYQAAMDKAYTRADLCRKTGRPYKASKFGLEPLVFGPIRELFGGRMRLVVSGGAALSPDICRMIDVWGIDVVTGYGLTESGGPSVVQQDNRLVVGSVGTPLPGTEVMIAPPTDGRTDGEILLRGPHIAKGYYNDPKAMVDADGWFHTGDLGRIDDGGQLHIAGRLKFSGKLSNGKYVAPELIETLLTATGIIAQAVVVMEGRNFVSAVLALDPDGLQKWVDTHGVGGTYAQVTADARTHAMLRGELADKVNQRLERWEQVKRFVVADEPFTTDNDCLTPSGKVVRDKVQQRYAVAIDALYA